MGGSGRESSLGFGHQSGGFEISLHRFLHVVGHLRAGSAYGAADHANQLHPVFLLCDRHAVGTAVARDPSSKHGAQRIDALADFDGFVEIAFLRGVGVVAYRQITRYLIQMRTVIEQPVIVADGDVVEPRRFFGNADFDLLANGFTQGGGKRHARHALLVAADVGDGGETLRELRAGIAPDDEVFFLLGEDALADMPSDDAMLFLLKRMERARSNQEFFEQMAEP